MRKLQLVSIACLCITSLVSCSNNHSDTAKEYKLKNKKSIFITETHPVGLSLSTIEIKSKGFEHELEEIIEDADPISDVLIGDLDQNGYGEIYLVLTVAGSGSYGSVKGFASNKDKSLSHIYLPDVDMGNDLFTNYNGHDVFKIEDDKLVRIFPIGSFKDSIVYKRIVIYGLHPGEAGWQLDIEESMIQISN